MQKPEMTESTEPVSVEGFLRTVLRSGVLDRAHLQEALRNVPLQQREHADAVADHLVEAGKLSRFQAGKLLKGMAVGLVLGPFHVLAPIGKGGMGTVYLARDSRSQLLVALKVLPPKRAREEERVLSRFRREMEMCQRVAHPHLAWAYEVGVCQGVYYIAMEYIPGRSLYRLVNDEGPLEISRAARLFAEVASAFRAQVPDGHIRGYVSTAFECPYAGRIEPIAVGRVARILHEQIEVDEVSIGDTIGVAVPDEVKVLHEHVAMHVPQSHVAWHFHDTRGTAIANVSKALDLGYRVFDSSAGGLGGCPFAPGAGGNLATEDLVYFLERSGILTGVDLVALSRASLPVLRAVGRAPAARAQVAALAG